MRSTGPIVFEAPRVRPWVGFGRAGWVALVILASLVVAVVAGWDPYLATLHLVARVFGGDAVPWYAIFAALYPRLALSSIQCSAITALAGTLALWTMPGRFPWLRLAILWMGCIALSSFSLLLFSDLLRPWLAWGAIRSGPGFTNPGAWVVILLLSVVIVRVGSASNRPAIVALVVGILGIAWEAYALTTARPAPPISIGVTWQAIVSVTMVLDALIRRSRAPTGEGPWCARCVHSLRGGTPVRCPECGADLTTNPALPDVSSRRSSNSRLPLVDRHSRVLAPAAWNASPPFPSSQIPSSPPPSSPAVGKSGTGPN